jgi:hypothetical protein
LCVYPKPVLVCQVDRSIADYEHKFPKNSLLVRKKSLSDLSVQQSPALPETKVGVAGGLSVESSSSKNTVNHEWVEVGTSQVIGLLFPVPKLLVRMR